MASSGSCGGCSRPTSSVDHVNRLGWTALLEAVILGGGDAAHTEVVRMLVEEGGADDAIADNGGKTALDHARENGYDRDGAHSRDGERLARTQSRLVLHNPPR